MAGVYPIVPMASAVHFRAMTDAAHTDLQRAQAHLHEQEDAMRIQLIATELDLGITFCQVAATTSDPVRYKRNIANAGEAYSAVLRFLGLLHQPDGVAAEFQAKLSQLESLLGDSKPPLVSPG